MVLHDDYRDRRVRQNPAQPRPPPVHPGPDLAHHVRHHDALRRDPLGEPGDLPVQTGPLIVARHPRIHHRPATVTARHNVTPDHAPRPPPGRHRHPVLPQPPIPRPRIPPIPASPLTHLHRPTKHPSP